MKLFTQLILCAGIVLLPSMLTAKEDGAVFSSSETQVRLVELYTSEGCSSCPPAERWFSDLLNSPHLWSSLVPIAFHVSYWDYLGWLDPFALEEHAQRQRAYAKLGDTGVYTPGFFVNGREWRGFFERNSLPASPTSNPGVLVARQLGDHRYAVSFREIESDESNYRVHAAIMGFDLISQVRAGENRGRNLRHDFVVLSTRDAVLKKGTAKHTVELRIKPPDANSLLRYAISFWITALNNPIPIQATGGFVKEKT